MNIEKYPTIKEYREIVLKKYSELKKSVLTTPEIFRQIEKEVAPSKTAYSSEIEKFRKAMAELEKTVNKMEAFQNGEKIITV